MNTNILIVVCTNRGVQPQTMQCLMDLEGDFDVLVCEEGYTIAENRNYASVQAINGKYSWMLFVDDDMTFEPGLIEELIINDKDICGVTYRPRCDDSNKKTYHETHRDNLKSDKLFETDGVGTGIMLIKTKILLNIPRPWFDFEWFENGCCKMGEDWMFCKKAKASGFKVWCNPTISVGHLGEKIV